MYKGVRQQTMIEIPIKDWTVNDWLEVVNKIDDSYPLAVLKIKPKPSIITNKQ